MLNIQIDITRSVTTRSTQLNKNNHLLEFIYMGVCIYVILFVCLFIYKHTIIERFVKTILNFMINRGIKIIKPLIKASRTRWRVVSGRTVKGKYL